MNSGKLFWHGKNKKGYPCIICKVKYNDNKISSSEKMKFLMYTIDEIAKKLEREKIEKFCLIWDREGVIKEKNWDKDFNDELNLYRNAIIHVFGWRIDSIYVLHINWFF
jgi:hypothetical protein